MTSTQQPDILVPVLEIEKGWSIDDLKTIEDCDDAHAVLTAAIISIDGQIDRAKEERNPDGDWRRRLVKALRWKKAAMQAVQIKRGEISRRAKREANQADDRRVLDYIRARHPAVFKEALAAVQVAP